MGVVNPWFAAATVLLFEMGLCGVAIYRSSRLIDGFIVLQMAGTLAILILLLVTQGMQRPAFFDLALMLALLVLPAALLSTKFLEKWLP